MSDKAKPEDTLKEDNLQKDNLQKDSQQEENLQEDSQQEDNLQADHDNVDAETEEANEEPPKADGESAQKSEPSFSDYDQAYRDIYDEILERFRSFSPSEEIASKITEEHITEYLEGNREEQLQNYKERREKRFLSALEVLAVLAAIILIVKFLSDSPAILVNILYIIGGLLALWIWKMPHDKDR